MIRELVAMAIGVILTTIAYVIIMQRREQKYFIRQKRTSWLRKWSKKERDYYMPEFKRILRT